MWRVDRGFEYHVGKKDSGNIIYVPKDFVTDFASVPKLFWGLFPPDGNHTQAAVVHDYLYWTQIKTRQQSDMVFREAMSILSVSAWRNRVMYRAVRMFGWMPWNKRAKELKKYGKDARKSR